MDLKLFIPFHGKPVKSEERSLDIFTPKSSAKAFSKLFKVSAQAMGFLSLGFNRVSFENSPYDFQRIIKAIDTDSYLKQGMSKYRELIWKQGWFFSSKNPEVLSYIKQRIAYMEQAMKRPFDDFLLELGDQLAKFGNVFVVKARANFSPYFPLPLKGAGDQNPVIGYYLIPVETVQILRDKFNTPLQYRQSLVTYLASGSGQNPYPTWDASEVIHLYMDKKPGRAFGTPFLEAALDDVIALRQIEEDIQNLIHRELFPLYKYKIGTPEVPADDDEIQKAKSELESLRTEGGLILPERHDVDVIGGNGKALDASGYLDHFKERVAVGLGLSQHHLGMTANGGNRSVTDRLDIAIYDRIKVYQRYLSSMLELFFIDEWLLEGGFDPLDEEEDCEFRFNEIDIDTQVAIENHILQKWMDSMIDIDEVRLALGYPPEFDEEKLYIALQAKYNPKVVAGAATTPAQNATSNKSQPTNQHGKLMSPGIRHSDWVDDIREYFEDEE